MPDLRKLFSARRLGLTELNFRDSPATSDPRFVAFASAVRADVAAYLFVRDDSRGSGAVQADMWLAPYEFPDDRLDNLGIGFRTLLARTFREPDQKFTGLVADRAQLFFSAAAGVAAAVASELQAPFDVAPRLSIYCAERRTYFVAREFATIPQGQYVVELLDAAERTVRVELSWRAFAEVAARCADRFIRDVSTEPTLTELRSVNPLIIREGLKSQAYAEALLA